MPGEVIGGELGSHAAPAERQARAYHRHLSARAAEHAQQIRQEAGDSQADEHQRDRQLLRGVGGAAWRREHTRADHAEHNRAHCHVLVPARVLAQHPLGEEHQHQQPRRQGRLHDHERGEQQCHHLQRPAEDRQSGPDQPASAPEEPPRERQAQVLLVRGLLGVHRLESDP
jgi:hypothetical protein